MELTIEQKQKRNNYSREYYKEHKEEMNAYSKEYYKNNREYYRNYYKNYRVLHKEHMAETQKKWREFNDKRDTVYMFINDLGENIYVGSTTYKGTRLVNHLTGNSNLKLTAEELVSDYNLVGILYKEFTEYNLSREDLYLIENFYLEKQGSILNKKPIVIHEENLTRSKEELIDIAEKVEYKEFDKLERYLD
ncbi:hypothetical protein DE167_004903 [Clostridium beijerinckii]|nr:hypothetical protein [Clostridium beijerinckii]